MMFLIRLWIRKIRWKRNKEGEKITVSLEKLKCAKTDSPTCKMYWLTHRQIENLQGITSWKISVEQAFHIKSSNAYIEHLSLWSTRSVALPHVKLMIIVNSLGFDSWGYSSIRRGDRVDWTTPNVGQWHWVFLCFHTQKKP